LGGGMRSLGDALALVEPLVNDDIEGGAHFAPPASRYLQSAVSMVVRWGAHSL
jgi:hypothetical protein